MFLFLGNERLLERLSSQCTGPRGVKFAEKPRQEPYGMVVVFFDLYGNKWDLLQRNDA